MIDPVRAVFVYDREKLLVIFRTSKFRHDSFEVVIVTDQHTAPHQLDPAILQDFRLIIEEAMRVSIPE